MCTVTEAAKPGIPLENVGKVSSVLPVMDNFLPRVTIKRRKMSQSGVCTDWAVAKGSIGVGILALCPGEQLEEKS